MAANFARGKDSRMEYLPRLLGATMPLAGHRTSGVSKF